MFLILEKGAKSVQGEKRVFPNYMNYMQITVYDLLIPSQWVVAFFVLLLQVISVKKGKKYPYTVPYAKTANVSSSKVSGLCGVLGVGSSLVVT